MLVYWWDERGTPLPGLSSLEHTDRLLEEASHRPTLVDAIAAVVTRSIGESVHVCRWGTQDDPEGYGEALMFRAGDSTASHTITAASAAEWSPDDAKSWYLLAARREQLEALLHRIRVRPGSTPDRMLRIPHHALVKARAQASGALSMWWHDRMMEGHNRESARLLLGMSMDPLMWAELVWPEGDVPPHFWWSPATVHTPPAAIHPDGSTP